MAPGQSGMCEQLLVNYTHNGIAVNMSHQLLFCFKTSILYNLYTTRYMSNTNASCDLSQATLPKNTTHQEPIIA